MRVPHFPVGTIGELLLMTKRRGEISLDDAEATIGLTWPTLRQHLEALERGGLVAPSTKRGLRGRPALRYALDGFLLGGLFDHLLERGEDALVRDFFERCWDERLQEVQGRLHSVPDGGDASRLTVLAEVLREQGFMPEAHRNGCVTIRACNCPFPEAVKQTRLPCRLEAAFYERRFDNTVERVTYLPDGFAACTYEFAGPQGEKRSHVQA